MCGTVLICVLACVIGTAPMLHQWMSSAPKSTRPDSFKISGGNSSLLDRQAKLAHRQQEIMYVGRSRGDTIPGSPPGGSRMVEERLLRVQTQGIDDDEELPLETHRSCQSLQGLQTLPSQGSWSVHDANRRSCAYLSDGSSRDGGESFDDQAFTEAQRMRQELATDERTILQHHRHLLEEAKDSPHLVPAPLQGEEAQFLKWVARSRDIGGPGDGVSKQESNKQMAAAAGIVLDALRYDDVRRSSPLA